MKDSQVYLKAAKGINDATYKFCCTEIDKVAGSRFSHQRTDFTLLFSPDGNTEYVWGEGWGDKDIDRKSCRVLALLFMHQIALDEES